MPGSGRHCNTRPAYGITDLCIPAGEGGFMRFWYPASQSDIVWVWRTHWLSSCGADSCVGYASAWGAHTQKYEVSSRVAAEMGPNLDMGQSEKHSLEGRHE